ncbi:MAG: NAD(P)H-hydrate dehydratase [Desulfobacterales bacterium]|nr:NAD(P)H-hydrate dehydratase [Desulfobacterales bacterium]
MYLVTAEEMQEMDRLTITSFGLPGRILMENAGRGVTQSILTNFPNCHEKKIGIIAGSGNNGGDGFVVARYLAQKGIQTSVFLLASSEKLKGDAAENYKLLSVLQIPVYEILTIDSWETLTTSVLEQDIWVDALLGTGLKSDVKGFLRDVIQQINQLNKPVIAVDLPSGIDTNSGQPLGEAMKAYATVTFAFPKIGHVIYPGVDYTGKLEVVDIGIPTYISEEVSPRQFLLTPDEIQHNLHDRPGDIHKGKTGHVFVLAGSYGKTGAAVLSSMAALRAGAGLVTLGIPESLNPILESQLLEAMTLPLPETIYGVFDVAALDTIVAFASAKNCLALGPGIGTHHQTVELVSQLLSQITIPMVIDADGINCLTKSNLHLLKHLKKPAVLTPHPGEMARLINESVADIQQNRIHYARYFAETYNVHLVLKGARTVIAHPDGRVFVNPTGNSGMAQGGMGDVLTGLIAGFIAQGMSQEQATHVGVYLHGASADQLFKTVGPYGYLASEVINQIPHEIQRILSINQHQTSLKDLSSYTIQL